MSGLSRRLLIGARSSELSVRCNASAGRNSSNPYPIPVAESDWVKKCWGSSKGHSKQTGHTQTHCYGRSSDMRALQNRANYTIRPRNHRSQRQNSSQNIAKMSDIRETQDHHFPAWRRNFISNFPAEKPWGGMP